MVGDDDTSGTGFQGLFRTLHRHDALEDKGLACHGSDVLELIHGLAAGGGSHPLQERQTGGVNVHGDGAGISGLYQIHFLTDGLQIPGLHSGNTAAAVGFQGIHGAFHDGGVGAVTGEGEDTGFGTALHQYIVIAQIVIFVAVMHSHGTNGAGHYGDRQLVAEEIIRGVHITVFADGVHIDAQLLPFLVVADGAGAQTLGTGTGDRVFAGEAVAHRAGVAFAHAGPGLLQNFLISHCSFLLNRIAL